jgi:fatty-acyl-CoA synthase
MTVRDRRALALPIDQRPHALSYSVGTGLIPLLGECVGEVLDHSAEANPEASALVSCHQNRRFTYAQFRDVVEQFARALLHLEIQKGDRVGIWATNCFEWAIVQFATAKIGAILVNINPSYRAYELTYALTQSECQTLIMVPRFRDSDFVSIFCEACPEATTSEPGALWSKSLPLLRNLILIAESVPSSFWAWNDVLRMGEQCREDDLRAREHTLSFDDPVNIQYTSGTTGRPKGAMLTHHNLVNNALLVGKSMKLQQTDSICLPVPFYHCFGMVMGNLAAVVAGAAIVIPAEYFDPLATLRAVANERCTALYGVPTMFRAELEHPEFSKFDLSSLRTGIMAGAPCPILLMKRVVREMHCREITIAYGQTESSPVITQTTTEDPIELRVNTVGKALPHTEVKIIDVSTGRIVPRGTSGELCTRAYSVMKGYYNDEVASKAAIDKNRWLHTGDIAIMDEEGYCNIVGRVKDMIIRGGENIYPREIEEFLYNCPGVSEVQVFGISDLKFGEEIAAFVKLKTGATTTPEDIKAYCKGKIASFKIPKYIKVVHEFPMTVTGKIQKFRMQQILMEELGLRTATHIDTA